MTRHSPGSERPASGQYRCAHCGGNQIEISLPAFFEANSADLAHVSTDYDAEALSYFCRDCAETATVVKPDGERAMGRWA